MKLRVATRKSPLALWQAEYVSKLLVATDPSLEIELVPMTTKGDKILDQALSKVGGKDLFVKEIEEALFDRRADIAVHSLKDMPTVLPEGLHIAAFPEREDPRDALVSPHRFTVESLPKGARVGTCSLRRQAQLLRRRPDLEIVPLRGNVQTRLKKVDEEKLHATILAYAGLKRLGLEAVVSEILDTNVSLPAIGQGILAIETRIGDAAANRAVLVLDHSASRKAATAERAFLHRLKGGCQVPIAGHATIDRGTLSMRGLVASIDGKEVFEATIEGAADSAGELGDELGLSVLALGASRILEAFAG